MNTRNPFKLGPLAVMVWSLCAAGFAQPPQDAPAVQEGVQVLTRGPVHEAFAETVSYDPEPGMTVTVAPPDVIDEIPPDEKPDGDNVAWIPGYWGWDDDSNNYLWVSGVWRDLPPGRQWTPGYWTAESSNWRWVSGYWADTQVEEVRYLPKPPRTLEVGPSIVAPAPDYIWTPGCWVWRGDRYSWRPGYWIQGRAEWTWVPSHYVCSPRGYVYTDGYWDYPVARRGVLYAPVHIETAIYTRPRYSYSPSLVINIGIFADQLFVRPRAHHYYFGDYYEERYTEIGFYSSFTYIERHHGYDPCYVQERWHHRDDHDWDRHVRDRYDYMRHHEDARPPRTYNVQVDRSRHQTNVTNITNVTNVTNNYYGNAEVASTLRRSGKINGHERNIVAVNQNERTQYAERAKVVQRERGERREMELNAKQVSDRGGPGKKRGDDAIFTTKRPRAEIISKSAKEMTPDMAPPARPDAPKLERNRRPGNDRNDKPGNDRNDKNNRDASREPGKPKVEIPGNDPNRKAERPSKRDEARPGPMSPDMRNSREDKRDPNATDSKRRDERPSRPSETRKPESRSSESRPSETRRPDTRKQDDSRKSDPNANASRPTERRPSSESRKSDHSRKPSSDSRKSDDSRKSSESRRPDPNANRPADRKAPSDSSDTNKRQSERREPERKQSDPRVSRPQDPGTNRAKDDPKRDDAPRGSDERDKGRDRR